MVNSQSRRHARSSELADPGSRSRLIKRIISAWLVFHLAAVVVAPAAVSPSSELIESTWKVFQPYLQLLNLNNGYHFFAPEPTDSTLLEYEAERADGTIVNGRIPNRQTWPRLLHHRYFMLTEQMNSGPDELEQAWYQSYAEHVAAEWGARKVRLTRVNHLLPTMEAVRGGMTLEHPESYETEPLGEFEWDTR